MLLWPAPVLSNLAVNQAFSHVPERPLPRLCLRGWWGPRPKLKCHTEKISEARQWGWTFVTGAVQQQPPTISLSSSHKPMHRKWSMEQKKNKKLKILSTKSYRFTPHPEFIIVISFNTLKCDFFLKKKKNLTANLCSFARKNKFTCKMSIYGYPWFYFTLTSSRATITLLLSCLIMVLAGITCAQSQAELFICSKLPSLCVSLLVCSLAKMSTPLWGFMSHKWLCNRVQMQGEGLCYLTNKTKPGTARKLLINLSIGITFV